MRNRTEAAIWPLGALSAVVLGLEVFESRLVAYSVQVMVVYVVLGVALLGFGAAGSLVALRQSWLAPERIPHALAWSSLAFSASIVVAHALFVRLTPYMTQVGWVAFLLSGVLSLPFLAAGTVITLVLSSTSQVEVAYAANLIGSGAGCFLPLTLLGPLTGARFLGFMALLAFGCAVPYLRRAWSSSSPALRAAGVVTLGVALVALVFAPSVFPIQPEPEPLGQLAWQYRYAAEHGITLRTRYDRWNPTGRIEIVELSHVAGSADPYPVMFYAQDSSAGSSLFAWDGRTRSQVRASPTEPGTMVSRLCTETLYGQGYFAPRDRVLVIGLGGGPDVQCALYNEAKAVDAVEINRDSIAAIRGPMNEWVGGIGTNPKVHLYVRDGRSFIRGRSGQYDLIQMSGVDTKNLMASGALALSENHLYTLEAIRDYLRLLAPGGALSILRFGEPEAIRLANTAVQALRDLGVAHPEEHIGMLHTGSLVGIIVRKTPWTDADARLVAARLAPDVFRGVSVYYYSQNGVPLDTPATIDFLPPIVSSGLEGEFFTHVENGSVPAFAAVLPFNIAPSTDDLPFFFDLWRYDRPETWQAPHVKALRALLLSVLGLSFVLVLLPVRLLGQRVRRELPLTIPLLFACLGSGFILLEVWLFHRFAMFLGHQVYSLSVVLASLLVATGVGAALGGRSRIEPGPRALLGIGSILLLLGVGVLVLPLALDRIWQASLPLRIATTVAFTVPLGLALGLPFAASLSHVGRRTPEGVPWCVGINGFASVFGSVAVVPLSMAFGYSGVLGVGVALYALAGLAGLGMRRDPPGVSGGSAPVG